MWQKNLAQEYGTRIQEYRHKNTKEPGTRIHKNLHEKMREIEDGAKGRVDYKEST
jgi:hypothetical protein